MNWMTNALATVGRAFAVAAIAVGLGLPAATVSNASEIKVVVNGVPITSYDIQRRAAFFRLSRKGGGANAAKEEMIDQALQIAEMKRLGIQIPDQSVNEAYARFASQNKLSTKQMDQIMAQSGVTKAHFKDFIRTQMGWGQALQSRYRAEGLVSENDAVKRMLGSGGQKPTATEYMLQQVIFVVPQAERKSKMAARKREAEALRQRFRGCDSTREFAKGLVDVTVRDLGRILAPELPPDWEKSVKAAQAGQATPVRETDKGVEFLGVCSAREVSDDRVAQMVFSTEGTSNERADSLSKKYLGELRAKAKIQQR